MTFIEDGSGDVILSDAALAGAEYTFEQIMLPEPVARELAHQHRDEVVEGSGRSVSPKDLRPPVSGTLRDLLVHHLIDLPEATTHMPGLNKLFLLARERQVGRALTAFAEYLSQKIETMAAVESQGRDEYLDQGIVENVINLRDYVLEQLRLSQSLAHDAADEMAMEEAGS